MSKTKTIYLTLQLWQSRRAGTNAANVIAEDLVVADPNATTTTLPPVLLCAIEPRVPD
jgi:hypothetical protein